MKLGIKPLTEQQELAIQLSHNAIAGQDDPVILKELWDTLGDVNLPLVIAGQLVNPGDVVVADDDGVVIVARDEVRGVTAKSREREDKEVVSRAKLRRIFLPFCETVGSCEQFISQIRLVTVCGLGPRRDASEGIHSATLKST